MSTRQDTDNHKTSDLGRIHQASEQDTEERQTTAARDLLQLFSLDLAHCPRFDRATEYTLACRARSAWLRLIMSLKAQHPHLTTLLSKQHLPLSYDTLSEPEILRLLHQVHVRVDLAETHEADLHMASVRSWVAQMKEDLARFRGCRDEMVRHNLRFVVMLARRDQHRSLGILDLVQEGALGLMRAVEKFDPERGVRFASYAVWWIREAFARALASREDTICFSDTPPKEKEDSSPADLVPAPEETSPETAILTADTARGLSQALTYLPVQEADIIRLRFGLGEGHTHTLEQVGQRLGLSREQVRLREQRALARLRAYMQRPDAAARPDTQELRQRWRTAA